MVEKATQRKAMSMPPFACTRHSSKPKAVTSMQQTLLLCVGLVVLVSMVLLGCEGEDDSGARSASTTEADNPSTTRPITTRTMVFTADGPPSGEVSPLVVVYYSAPRLDMEPRESVSIEVSLSRTQSLKTVEARVEITNSSGSSFRFSPNDLRLFVNRARVEQKRRSEKPREIPSRADGGSVIFLGFDAPDDFDPAESGLVYVCSDPANVEFTRTDGKVPARYAR